MKVTTRPNSQLSTSSSYDIAKAALGKCSLGCAQPNYLAALEFTLQEEPPPHCTSTYADIFASAADELPRQIYALISGAERTAADARRYWLLGRQMDDPNVMRTFKQCAIEKSDEVVHWLELLKLSYPHVVSPNLWEGLWGLSPGYSLDSDSDSFPTRTRKTPSLEDLIVLNLYELRAAILKLLLFSVLGVEIPFPVVRREGAADNLFDRSLKCISLTAGVIEPALSTIDRHAAINHFLNAIRQSIRDTSEEAADLVYHSRFGSYP